ncbi:MAG: Wzz/FepE/Etk N-terminal domain-containing protein [Acidobacteriota bacterium]
MQPTEAFSVPRRSLDVEDYIDILRRHKGWIFGPFLLTLVVSVVGVYLWPDTYKSEALIQIKPPQIAGNIIPASNGQDIADRINQLSQQVMSRGELTNLIRNLNLYPRERNRLPLEEVLDKMRKDIDILPSAPIVAGRSVPAFKVVFSYYNRLDAQKVVTQLVASFLSENIKTRDRMTFQNQDFFQSQTEQAKKRMDDISTKITEWKLAHPGKLPEQAGANYSALASQQSQLMDFTQQVARSQQDKVILESQIRSLQSRLNELSQESKVVTAAQVAAKSPRLQGAENRVERLELELAEVRKTYTDKNQRTKQVQAALDTAREALTRTQADEAANKQPDAAPISVPNLAGEREKRDIRSNIETIEAQVKAKDLEVQNLEKQGISMRANIEMLNARIQSMPTGDQEWNDLMREEALARDEYVRMTSNLNNAKISADLEGRKQGETLEQLEPPSLPEDHTDPNRPIVISIGAGMGLMLGLVLAGAREMKDTSLKNLKDVRAYTQMAILGSVPLLENDFVVRRRRRIAWLGWTVACLTGALVMVGAIVYYYMTKV